MTPLTFHLILHTHWDREWYLPRAGFVARLVPAVGEVLDMLDRAPDVVQCHNLHGGYFDLRALEWRSAKVPSCAPNLPSS